MDQKPILTFNHHESYLCALAGLPLRFDVVTRKGTLDLSWNIRARAVPSNMTTVDFGDIRDTIRKGGYRVIICHTIKNLFWLLPYQRRHLVFVAHIPLFKTSFSHRARGLAKKAIVLFWQKVFGLTVVAVSEFKRASWGVEAEVAKFFPVPFAQELLSERKHGEIRGAYVGNLIRERGSELGWPTLEKLLARGAPIQVIGNNPSVSGAFVPRDFTDFVQEFSKAHFYVYPVSPSDGDGYNTASLEAMLLGLPTVAIANPTSPIRHNENGLVAKSAEEMLLMIEQLRTDHGLRERLGRTAKATVTRDFNPEAFWQTWARVIEAAQNT
jgi:glycosyltransferase involved in cell wall biosynthesis